MMKHLNLRLTMFLFKENDGFEIDDEVTNLDPLQFGHVRNVAGKWASCIRVISPFQGDTLQQIELEENEAAFSIALVQFRNNPHSTDSNEQFVAVGTGKDVTLAPKTCSSGFIHLYRFVQGDDEQTQKLELIHKTAVDDVPMALIGFQGRLLAGVGKAVRIYDVGKKKLLRKCETKVNHVSIISIMHSFC